MRIYRYLFTKFSYAVGISAKANSECDGHKTNRNYSYRNTDTESATAVIVVLR